jgi:hypothetical protein
MPRWAHAAVVALLVPIATSCVLPGVPVNTGSGSRRVLVPATIDATGRTDVHDVLKEFLSRVPNGGTAVFPAGARYRVEETMRFRDRQDLTFEGNGATIFATARGDYDRSQIFFLRGRNITVRNLIVRGAHPNGGTSESAYVAKLEAQHGFRFEGTQHVLLDRVTVTDVYGDFVYIGKDFDTHVWSQHVTVRNSTFARNGRQGITVTAGRHVLIEHNDIRDTRRATIDLEPNTRSWGAEHVTIANNTVGAGRLMFIAAHGQGPVNHVTVTRNNLFGHLLNIDVVAPEGTRRTNWVITGNRSDKPARQRTIRLGGVDDVVVRDNKQRVTKPGEPAIVLWGGCRYQVAGNILQHGTVSMTPTACA